MPSLKVLGLFLIFLSLLWVVISILNLTDYFAYIATFILGVVVVLLLVERDRLLWKLEHISEPEETKNENAHAICTWVILLSLTLSFNKPSVLLVHSFHGHKRRDLYSTEQMVGPFSFPRLFSDLLAKKFVRVYFNASFDINVNIWIVLNLFSKFVTYIAWLLNIEILYYI